MAVCSSTRPVTLVVPGWSANSSSSSAARTAPLASHSSRCWVRASSPARELARAVVSRFSLSGQSGHLGLQGRQALHGRPALLERRQRGVVRLLPVTDPETLSALARTVELGLERSHRLLHRLPFEVRALVSLARRVLVGAAHPNRRGRRGGVLGTAADRARAPSGQPDRELGRHPGDPLLPQVEMVLTQVKCVARRLVEQDPGVREPAAQEDGLLGCCQTLGCGLDGNLPDLQLRGDLTGLEQLGLESQERLGRTCSLRLVSGDLELESGQLCRERGETGALVVQVAFPGQPRLRDGTGLVGPGRRLGERGRSNLTSVQVEELGDLGNVQRCCGLRLRRSLLCVLGAQRGREHRCGPAVGVDRLAECRLDVGGLVELSQGAPGAFAASPGVGQLLGPVARGPAELELLGGLRQLVGKRDRLGRGMLGQAPCPSRQLTVTCDLLEVVGVPFSRKPHSRGFLDPADHGSAPVVAVLAASAKGDPALDEPALDLLEAPSAEQPLQHGVPLRRGRPQERLEPALGQHRHLGELRARHSEQVGHQLTGLVEAVGERDPLTASVLLDDDVSLHPGGAGAATLGPVPRGGAGEPERASTDARPQHHPRFGPGVRVVAAQVPRAVSVTGDLAVEREADGVEHAGLA